MRYQEQMLGVRISVPILQFTDRIQQIANEVDIGRQHRGAALAVYGRILNQRIQEFALNRKADAHFARMPARLSGAEPEFGVRRLTAAVFIELKRDRISAGIDRNLLSNYFRVWINMQNAVESHTIGLAGNQ